MAWWRVYDIINMRQLFVKSVSTFGIY